MTTTDQTTRIGIELEEISRTPHGAMDDGQKQAVQDMLITAGNGVKSGDVVEVVGAVVVYMARTARYEPERLQKAIDRHENGCPLRNGMSGRYAALYPYRWPLVILICVALISPYAGPVLARAIERHIDAGMDAAISKAVQP